jgi:Flp pilus assembly protein TadG
VLDFRDAKREVAVDLLAADNRRFTPIGVVFHILRARNVVAGRHIACVGDEPSSQRYEAPVQARVWLDSLGDRGAVFVEKLIVYLPLLLCFFGAWELAELGAASIVVQRASAAAGRAAVVVLPDDPAFYEDEPVGSFDGKRRTDVELAAAMILSAVPRFSEDFIVDVSDAPADPAPIDVTVTAKYDCGLASLVCGSDDSVELTSTTKHMYQGAKYTYTSPALGGGTGALLARSGSRDEDDVDYADAFRAGSVSRCDKGAAIDNYTNPNAFGRRGGAYGTGLSKEALRYRCQNRYSGTANVAIVFYRCPGVNKTCTIGGQSGNFQAHGERQAIAAFEAATAGLNCTIEGVYTEREPCQDGQRCAGFLARKGLSENQVIYTAPYNPAGLDPRTDPYYARGRQQCKDLKKDARECGRADPPLSSCEALKKYLSKNNLSGRACLEYVLAQDDLDRKNARDYWNDDLKADIKARMDAECATLRNSTGSYGTGSDCTRPPPRDPAVIRAEIASKEAALKRARDRLRRPGPYDDPRRLANEIARLEQQLGKLRGELQAAGG